DLAGKSEERTGGRRRDAVLARPCLGDDAPLPHLLGEQDLPQRVVQLVSARVAEVLSFEEDARASSSSAQPLRLVEGRGPSNIVPEEPRQPPLKVRLLPNPTPRQLECLDRRDQRLRHEAPSI